MLLTSSMKHARRSIHATRPLAPFLPLRPILTSLTSLTSLSSLTPISVAVSLAIPGMALAAGALPQGGRFVAGTGTISGNATSLTINQTSNRGVIDWTGFSIGSGNHVNIDNGTGATLNRVTGTAASSILGTLSATGSVYLINPQGIVIGSSGVVSTGGRFVASTLDTANAAFMNGGPLTFSGPAGAATGTVVNLGNIATSGGDVFLIANKEVDNVGSIAAPKGTAEVVAAQQVLLQDSTQGQQVLVQQGSAGKVVNRGTIEAAQISLQAADGNVYALAGNHAVLRATGTATRDGHVWLVADTGRVWMDGIIEANNADGSGGTVDTDAARLRIAGDPSVKAKQWNIVMPSFTIDGYAAPVFQNNLNAGTSIDLHTNAASGTTGDIDVASSIHWNGAASLTLCAYHSLTIEAAASLKNSGSANLILRADSQAIDNGGSLSNNGTVDWSASQGIVAMYRDMNGTYNAGNLLTNASWTAPADSGLATQITSYKLINFFPDLENVNADLTGNYALGRDIDASRTSNGSYVPIGGGNSAFTGQFDGRGHTITALTMQGTGPNMMGMFGTLGSGAVVRDLNVNGSLSMAVDPQDGWEDATEGILAGMNQGTILRVNTSGSIWDVNATQNVSLAGGLVGLNVGTIERSSSAAIVNSGSAGGLVGENDGLISQSHASGQVQGATSVVISATGPAGLVSDNHGTITQSYSTGVVVAECNDTVCGGAAGLVYDNFYGVISQSFAAGTVEAGRCGANGCGTGAGLVFNNVGAEISQSYSTGLVVANGCVTASNCGSGAALVYYNNGQIAQSFAAGLVLGPSVQSPTGPQAQRYGITADNEGWIGGDVYWDKQATTAMTGAGTGTPVPDSNGLTTAQMSNPGNFAGWDFSSGGVWAIPAGADHPVLRWQLAPTASD